MFRSHPLRGPSLVVLVCLLTACGGGSPSGQTPVPTPSTTLPGPPAPTPQPTPVPPGARCPLPAPPAVNARCAAETPTFLTEVDTAINQLVQQHPEIFDLTEERGAGGYRVLSNGAYYVGLIQNLEAMNLCANFDGEEVQVKNTNDFNDQYHVLVSSGHVRRGPSSYRVTCYPASFGPPAPLPGPVAGCSLGGSREIACGRETQHFLADVEAAIDQLIREQPGIFDVNDVAPGTNFVKVLDVDRYVQGVVTNLNARGKCAHWDGEEMAVKSENRFSDHYDILTAQSYTRRGEGSYRSSCYPAAF